MEKIRQFAQNIVRGAGTIIDIYPTQGKYIIQRKQQISDSDALRQDWERVGDTLSSLITREMPHDEE